MDEDAIEISYSSSSLGGGYYTEIVRGRSVSTQGAMNLIRARVPDARFNGITIRHQPPTQPADPNRRW